MLQLGTRICANRFSFTFVANPWTTWTFCCTYSNKCLKTKEGYTWTWSLWTLDMWGKCVHSLYYSYWARRIVWQLLASGVHCDATYSAQWGTEKRDRSRTGVYQEDASALIDNWGWLDKACSLSWPICSSKPFPAHMCMLPSGYICFTFLFVLSLKVIYPFVRFATPWTTPTSSVFFVSFNSFRYVPVDIWAIHHHNWYHICTAAGYCNSMHKVLLLVWYDMSWK